MNRRIEENVKARGLKLRTVFFLQMKHILTKNNFEMFYQAGKTSKLSVENSKTLKCSIKLEKLVNYQQKTVKL